MSYKIGHRSYCLFRIGETVHDAVASCNTLDEVTQALCNHILYKTTADVNRGIYLHKEKGIEKYIEKVAMEAGDLLIFNSLLPHGIRPNLSKDKVRIAQYISMMPAEEDNKLLKQWRINSWKNRIAPEGYAFPGDPRNWEQKKYCTAKLSILGEKLLGKTSWN